MTIQIVYFRVMCIVLINCRLCSLSQMYDLCQTCFSCLLSASSLTCHYPIWLYFITNQSLLFAYSTCAIISNDNQSSACNFVFITKLLLSNHRAWKLPSCMVYLRMFCCAQNVPANGSILVQPVLVTGLRLPKSTCIITGYYFRLLFLHTHIAVI